MCLRAFALTVPTTQNALPSDTCKAASSLVSRYLLRCYLLQEAFSEHLSNTPSFHLSLVPHLALCFFIMLVLTCHVILKSV